MTEKDFNLDDIVKEHDERHTDCCVANDLDDDSKELLANGKKLLNYNPDFVSKTNKEEQN